jgi:hypothetical protein
MATMTRSPLIVVLTVLALGLSSCALIEPRTVGGGPAEVEQTAGGSTDEFREAKIDGAPWVYDDGFEIMVMDLHEVTFSEMATDMNGNVPSNGVGFTVTLVNGTDAVFDGSMVFPQLRSGDDGTPAESVYDDGYIGYGEGSIPPGGKLSFKAAFTGVTLDDADLVVVIEPGALGHGPAFFVP